MNVAVLCTENSTFSMITAAGMASMKAARSILGSVRAYRVGSWWVVGCRAMFVAVISTNVGWVGGSDSWDGFPSISVSLGGAGGSRRVFLVVGAILLCAYVSREKKGKNDIDLLVCYMAYNLQLLYNLIYRLIF